MVLACSPVHVFEYYDAMAADVRKLMDRAARTLRRSQKARAGLNYFDHAGDDGTGQFVRLCRSAPDPTSLFSGIATGDIAQTTIVRRLADRRHPKTGQPLPIKHLNRWLADKGQHAKKVVGHDIQISSLKAVSILYGLGSPSLRAMIASAHHRAIAKVLVFIRDNGLVITRSGQDGWRREPVDDVLIASYFHQLSRANDPHLHTHSVLMNICRRTDGSIGAIDTQKLVAYGKAMTELYRAELASILCRELGLSIVKEQHGFTLAAVPKEVIELFSKRRLSIEEEAESRGFETGRDRKAAQKVSYDTRRSKAKGVTSDSLRAGWEAECRAIGHDPASFMPAIEAACATHSPVALSVRAIDMLDRADLIEAVYAHDAQLSWPELLHRVVEQVQTSASADEALALANEVRDLLVPLPGHDRGEKLYTSATVIEAEHALLKGAIKGRHRWKKLTPGQVEIGLRTYSLLSEEQRFAVRHALNRDRVAVINGSAGAGKSFMSFAVARIAEQHGLRVIGVSAAWTAAHVLRREARLIEDNTFSLEKLRIDLAKGHTVLTDKTVVIVDEAGMAPLVAIADLVRQAEAAGAKIVLVGDVKQLQPVAFGAPMRALAAELGYAELVAIRRQRHDWMREASVNLAAHRFDIVIDTYDNAGCLAVHVDRSTTLANAADDYVSQVAGDTGYGLPNQLMITPRNRDVTELNGLVRARLQAKGTLGADVVRVRALPRGKREGSEPVDLGLAIGDRIIFGARLELGSRTIFNSDVARILWIEPAGANPRLTFVLDRLNDDGQPLSFMARYRELISPFSESKVPQIQHGYAVTVHAAQGATVERAIVVDVEGLCAEHSYVAMTRHRERLSIHLNAEKSLSRRRREVVRLSRRNQLVDDLAPEHRSEAITDEEREAAIQLAKARARRPQRDSNPSFHIFDKAAWLDAAHPVAEFRRQASRPGARGGVGRLEPRSPQPAAFGDATVLSATEMTRLNAVSFTSEPVITAFDLVQTNPAELVHRPSGTKIALVDGRPAWSSDQNQVLERQAALGDHPLVQAALLLLAKPLRWARAWVRRSFGLLGLNPLADFAHREERRRRDRTSDLDRASTPLEGIVNPDFPVGDRRARRHTNGRRFTAWEQLAAADQALAAPKPARILEPKAAALAPAIVLEDALTRELPSQSDSQSVQAANEWQTTRAAPRFPSHAMPSQSASPSPSLVIQKSTESSVREPYRFTDSPIGSEPDQTHERRDMPRDDGSMNAPSMAPFLDSENEAHAKAYGRKRRLRRFALFARQHDQGDIDRYPAFEVAEVDTVAELADTQSLSPVDLAAGSGSDVPRHIPAEDPTTGSVSALVHRAGDSMNEATQPLITRADPSSDRAKRDRLLRENTAFRIAFLNEISQQRDKLVLQARGNPLDRTTWGEPSHILRVGELSKEFETLKHDVQQALAKLVQLQVGDLKIPSDEADLTARHSNERTQLADIYRALLPSIRVPYGSSLPTSPTPGTLSPLSAADATELLAMLMATPEKTLEIRANLGIAGVLAGHLAAPLLPPVLLARAHARMRDAYSDGATKETISAWANAVGGPAPFLAGELTAAISNIRTAKRGPAASRITSGKAPGAL
ncbi:MAG: relaxase domain-containing protein [Bosea sp.]|uniref:MobF family relaxase n=1 Tax=Bosea sp. (in: a-proteobacteria) TaxID=1871050 RepID=UPI00238A314B|nr:relaxase domain-containing protein [Bosea sp. (in: a-proteobacteria)]